MGTIRGKHEGTFTARPGGRWQIRIMVNGRRISETVSPGSLTPISQKANGRARSLSAMTWCGGSGGSSRSAVKQPSRRGATPNLALGSSRSTVSTGSVPMGSRHGSTVRVRPPASYRAASTISATSPQRLVGRGHRRQNGVRNPRPLRPVGHPADLRPHHRRPESRRSRHHQTSPGVLGSASGDPVALNEVRRTARLSSSARLRGSPHEGVAPQTDGPWPPADNVCIPSRCNDCARNGSCDPHETSLPDRR